jgi:hypothetical protein
MLIDTDYSDRWCKQVVHDLTKSRARGCKIFMWYFNFPEHDFPPMLQSCLKRDQLRWRFLRDLINKLDKIPQYHGMSKISSVLSELLNKYDVFDWFLPWVRVRANDKSLKFNLDKWEKEHIIKYASV